MQEFLISPKQLGIPNSRLRYFMLAKIKKFHSDIVIKEGKIWESLPVPHCTSESGGTGDDHPCNIDDIQEPISKKQKIDINISSKNDQETNEHCLTTLQHYLEKGVSDEFKVPEKVLTRYIGVLDIVDEKSTNSTCFTKSYTQYAEGTGSVLNLIKTSCPKNLSSERNPNDFNLRYFTPREVANLMGFPKSFSFPSDVTRKQKYRMLGNSLNVEVVSYLISLLLMEDNSILVQ